MRYTLQDIERAKTKFLKAREIEQNTKCWDTNYDRICNKVNRLKRQYLNVKGSYFYGNN